MIYTTNLKKLRLNSHLTIREMSELSGVSKSTISEIENEITDFKVSTLVILAKFFDCNLDELINY